MNTSELLVTMPQRPVAMSSTICFEIGPVPLSRKAPNHSAKLANPTDPPTLHASRNPTGNRIDTAG